HGRQPDTLELGKLLLGHLEPARDVLTDIAPDLGRRAAAEWQRQDGPLDGQCDLEHGPGTLFAFDRDDDVRGLNHAEAPGLGRSPAELTNATPPEADKLSRVFSCVGKQRLDALGR